ncbi:hypothetical protein P171DRAFT_505014 [Karstenula rhodostoma CBS 690.94]|uniref:Uncharacterized protein n=1 Tax=Karstenula rhodostoma CBS 690.94 TaxID=1392251 RepID=A0A9P4U4L6_9PLEO|nr:hypothetical protein P171DRAFT_505014 [Karstenula rhodostoma CBS 690.94]
MAFRIGLYFDSSKFIRGAGIQRKPARRPLFDNTMTSTTTPFIKHDRRFRPWDDPPRWKGNQYAGEAPLNMSAGRKRAHDDNNADNNNVQTRPQKRPRKEAEWALIRCCRPLFCCLDFVLSFTPAGSAENKKEWEKKLARDEIEHYIYIPQQLTEHSDYIILNGRKLYTADAGYSVEPLSGNGTGRPTTRHNATEQGAQTSPRRPPGAQSSGPYYPGAPPPPSDDEDDHDYGPGGGAALPTGTHGRLPIVFHRPRVPTHGGGASGVHVSTPTPTQAGVHTIKLPGGLTHVTGPPIRQRPVDKEGYKARLPPRDHLGRLVDKKGRLVNEKGQLVNEKGQLVNRRGRRIMKLSEDPLPAPSTPLSVPQALPPALPLQSYSSVTQLVDEYGGLIDERGRLVNENGQLINEKGYLVDEHGRIPAYLFEEDDPWTGRPSTAQGAQAASSPTPVFEGDPGRPTTSVFEEEPPRPHAPVVRPPTPRPPIPETIDPSEPTSEDDTLATRLEEQQQPPASGATQPQAELPAVEPVPTQSNNNTFHDRIKKASAARKEIASAADPTVDPIRWLDTVVVPSEVLPEVKKPSRIPTGFQPYEEKQEEQKRKDNRTPYERFLAKESEKYAPLPPVSIIRSTPRGPYGLRLAPDMVLGESLPLSDVDHMLGRETLLDRVTFPQPKRCRIDNPGCQEHETKTFATGRELREHEITHDYMMFGGYGPPGTVDNHGWPYPISPGEREQLLREREERRNTVYPANEMAQAIAASVEEERQMVQRGKAVRERANRPLTEGDFAEEMTEEEFEQQFSSHDAPFPGEDFTEEEEMTGEEYQQQLLSDTIGDEMPVPGEEGFEEDPTHQQTYGYAVDGARAPGEVIFEEDIMEQGAEDYSWEQRQAQFLQQYGVQRVYTDEERLAMVEEDERRELMGY